MSSSQPSSHQLPLPPLRSPPSPARPRRSTTPAFHHRPAGERRRLDRSRQPRIFRADQQHDVHATYVTTTATSPSTTRWALHACRNHQRRLRPDHCPFFADVDTRAPGSNPSLRHGDDWWTQRLWRRLHPRRRLQRPADLQQLPDDPDRSQRRGSRRLRHRSSTTTPSSGRRHQRRAPTASAASAPVGYWTSTARTPPWPARWSTARSSTAARALSRTRCSNTLGQYNFQVRAGESSRRVPRARDLCADGLGSGAGRSRRAVGAAGRPPSHSA